MKKYNLLFLIFIIFGCNSKNTSINNSNNLSEKPKINNQILLSFIKDFIKTYPVKQGCYTLEFSNDDFKKYKNDTTILLSFVPCLNQDINYKGIFYIDTIPIALRDDDNLGLIFYDNSNINYQSLKKFNCESENIRPYVFCAWLFRVINKDSIELIDKVGQKNDK